MKSSFKLLHNNINKIARRNFMVVGRNKKTLVVIDIGALTLLFLLIMIMNTHRNRDKS